MASPDETHLRTVRLSKPALDALLNHLDNVPKEARVVRQRTYRRFPYRIRGMPVRLQQPGATEALLLSVPTRNISSGGLAFLHGGFVHTESRATMQLVRLDGGWTETTGTVNACRYIDQNIHEVAIEFDTPIDPGLFSAAAVSFDFLLVEDDDAVARLMEHHLGMKNVDVTIAGDAAKAIERAAAKRYDCILMDMELPGRDGFDVTRTIRESGYASRIIAMTAFDGSEIEQRCLEAGCDDLITKPVMPDRFDWIIKRIRQAGLVSLYQKDQGVIGLLTGYCDTLPSEIRSIRDLQRTGDVSGIIHWARETRCASGSFGYKELADAAQAIEQEAAAVGDAQRLGVLVDLFASIAKRIERPREARAA